MTAPTVAPVLAQLAALQPACEIPRNHQPCPDPATTAAWFTGDPEPYLICDAHTHAIARHIARGCACWTLEPIRSRT